MWKKKCQHLQMWRRDAIFRARERGISPTPRFLEETGKCQQHGGGWVLHEEGRDVSGSVVAQRKLFSGKEEVTRMEGPHPPPDSEKEHPKSAQNSTEKSKMLPGIFFTSSSAPKTREFCLTAAHSLSLSLSPPWQEQ